MLELSSFLEGRWMQGDAPHETLVSATTGDAIATTSTRGLDLGAALEHARVVGGPALRRMTFVERAELLKALARSIHAHRDELLDLSRDSYGATRGDAKFDVDGASGTLAYFASVGKRLGDRTWQLDGEARGVAGSKRFVGQHVLVPRRGVAVHINAYNFPAWGMCEKLAVSLLAGVPALVKPATQTALVTWQIVRHWHDEGLLPEGVVSLLTGEPGDLLDHLHAQDVVAFTGSSTTGRLVRGHPRVLELGVPVNVEADSLNAAVLGPDAEPGDPTFEMFCADLVRDLVQKAGQKCTAIRRAMVPASRLEDVKEALADLLSRSAMGDPGERGVDVGPLPDEAQLRRVRAGITQLEDHFEVLAEVPGEVPDRGFYVRPRVYVTDAGLDAPFVHEHEVFGPVSTVLTYDDDTSAEDLAVLVARGGGGLVTSVYSDDPAWGGALVLELAPWNGRIHWGSKRVAGQSPGPGTVMPDLVHGGPGKAGGGEELGGLRGLRFYQQRTAVQADRVLLERSLGTGDASA